MKVFGRDPAVIGMFIVLIVQNIFAFFVHVSPTVEGAIIITASAAWALVVAFMVHDGQVAAVLGFAQAIIAAVLAFGVHWSTTQQAQLMNLIIVGIAVITRTQVVAPVPGPLPPPSQQP